MDTKIMGTKSSRIYEKGRNQVQVKYRTSLEQVEKLNILSENLNVSRNRFINLAVDKFIDALLITPDTIHSNKINK
jgi:hypothetical protein